MHVYIYVSIYISLYIYREMVSHSEGGHGGMPPPSYNFFQPPPPSKPMPLPHGAHPQLKMKPPFI